MGNRISYLEFNKAFKSYPIISTRAVQKVFPTLDPRRLYEWKERGLIKSISKGFYVFEDTPIDELFLYYTANYIYAPSYISLHSALNWYNLIPEFVPHLTSVSTKKTTTFDTHLGRFVYFSLKEDLFFGYDLLQNFGKTPDIRIATPEKALLDLFYLNPDLNSKSHFDELRLNTHLLKEKLDLDLLDLYLTRFNNAALLQRVLIFKEFLKNA